MINLMKNKLENVFDPTDAAACMSVAYRALNLMILAREAIDTDNANMLLGRDQKTEIAVAIMDLAEILGLLPYRATAQEVNEFYKLLCYRKEEV